MHALPLHTPSLTLRHLAPGDAPALMRLNAEATTRRWLPSHVYADMAEAEAVLAALIAAYAEPGDPTRGPYVLGVAQRATEGLLGHIGFSPLAGDVEVSYAIAEEARGRGYGAEALAHACGWAAQTFALPRLVAITALENLASRRTLERAGFRHAGDLSMRFQGAEQPVSRYVWEAGESWVT
jgi:RimJ/RimL family protein N-acetyltransferase